MLYHSNCLKGIDYKIPVLLPRIALFANVSICDIKYFCEALWVEDIASIDFYSWWSLIRIFIVLDGEPKNLESAVATLEPIAKEYVTKWKSEDKEQVNQRVKHVTLIINFVVVAMNCRD